MTTVREATTKDIPGILSIWNPIILNTTITFTDREKTPANIEALLASEAPVIVVATKEQITGFATYGPFRSGPGYRFTKEISIYVATNAQGQSIGKTLYKAIEDRARQNDMTTLIACISGDNDVAIAFHQHMGFVITGQMPSVGWKFGKSQDLVFMQKQL